MLVVDGIAGPKTDAAILHYQQGRRLPSDGRVDPKGPTIRSLVAAYLAAINAGFTQIASGGDLTPPLPVETFVAVLKNSLSALRGK